MPLSLSNVTEVSALPFDALQLLPDPGVAMRCAEHAVSIGVDPGGSCTAANALAVIEVPLPWPKPVFGHELLQGLKSMMTLAIGPTRVLAAVPRDRSRPAPVSGDVRVTLFMRDTESMKGQMFEVPGNEGLLRLFDQLGDQHPTRADGRIAQLAPDSAVLVCTQGSHDVCCGSAGSRFANELEAEDPDLAVYRVSHTGGHRFAPTAMTLPSGRMWAGLDTQSMLSILDQSGNTAELAPRCRGWWGAPTGAAQVAERALFAARGWQFDQTPREVTVAETAGGWTVDIDAADGHWTMSVEVKRTVPTITCRAEGGEPAKPAMEYTVTSIAGPA